MNRKKSLSVAIGMSLTLGLFAAPYAAPADLVPSFLAAPVAEAASVGPGDVVLVGDLQPALGGKAKWAPGDAATIMKKVDDDTYVFKGKLPAGKYEYKIAVGGSWGENYGKDGVSDGPNMKLTLTEEKEVTFTYDDITHEVTVTYAGQGSAEEKAALAAAAANAAVKADDVVLVGTVQSALGAGKDWDPSDPKTIMKPDGQGHRVYKGMLKKGNYDYKVAVGGSWDVNYGKDGQPNGGNIALRLAADHEVTFTYDEKTHKISYSYDGMAAEQQKFASVRDIVLCGDLQTLGGAGAKWAPSDYATKMSPTDHGFYTFTIKDMPAGTYNYKIAINGSWAENYGLNGIADGANIAITLDKPETVTFYYNDKTHRIADSHSYKMLSKDQLPVLSGIPGVKDGTMYDLMLSNLYEVNAKVAAGDYTATISQKGQTPVTQNIHIAKSTDVAFYYDLKNKRLIADDGSIRADKVSHDSWSKAERSPWGAVSEGTPVTLKLKTGEGDVQNAKLMVTKSIMSAKGGDEYNPDYEDGTTTYYPMTKIGTENGQDIWQVTFTPQTYGLYGYKFVLNDTKEYGDDTKTGGTGELKLTGTKYFQITCYKKGYETPEWAKEAVCYQIFPDRFYDGNKANDNARTTARGPQPVQHRAWTDLPANSNAGAADGDKWDCNDFFGGDLAGITQKLDYLKGLGITAIYVNPIYAASSNHRYDARDYNAVDPFLGTFQDLETLSKEMAKRGMHLIMDGVFNHIGDDSVYFDRYGKYKTVGAYEYWSKVYDLMNTKNMNLTDAQAAATKALEAEGQTFSPWHWEKWFEVYNRKAKDEMGDKYDYHSWQGFSSLAPFRDKDYPGYDSSTPLHTDLGDYLLYGRGGEKGVIMKWFDYGLSGWRLDVAKEVPPGFWANVRKEVKSIKTMTGDTPLLLGEIWQDGSQFFTGDTMDSIMNYKLSDAIMHYVMGSKAQDTDDVLTQLRQNYPKQALYDLMNIVDSHDTARAIYIYGGGKDSILQAKKSDFDYDLGKARLKMAAAFEMGYPGMPTIYYGDEAGQFGSKDPDCRRTFPWGQEDKELQGYYKKIIAARNANKDVFALGDLDTILAKDNIYAYQRTAVDGSGKIGVVALNNGKAQAVTLKVNAADGKVLTDALTGTKATVQNGQITLNLGENQAMMLVG
jgi:cyclomaltodextrinase